jgi:hypothetical protein
VTRPMEPLTQQLPTADAAPTDQMRPVPRPPG